MLEDIHSDENIARRFLTQYQNAGIIERIAPKTYKKLAELGDIVEVKIKESKATVFAKLDQWLMQLPANGEFTSTDAAESADTTSAHFIKEWLKVKTERSQVVKLGSTKGSKYRKITKLTGIMSEIVK